MSGYIKEISEEEASGRIAELYEDIRDTLRTTQVNLFYRTLAVHEPYFAAAWEALRPNASITYFERCADSLRMRMVPPMPEDVPDYEEELEEECGYSEARIAEIDAILDLFNDVNPKNLILAAALRGAMTGLRIGGVKAGFEEDLSPLPRGPRPSMIRPRVPGPEGEDENMRRVFERIRAEGNLRSIPSVWRVLGKYPEFVERAWPFIREEQKKKGFGITLQLSQGAAAAAAQEFPHPVDLSREKILALGCSASEVDLIEQKLSHFIHLIPQTNISILLMKAALAGEGKVRRKPFE